MEKKNIIITMIIVLLIIIAVLIGLICIQNNKKDDIENKVEIDDNYETKINPSNNITNNETNTINTGTTTIAPTSNSEENIANEVTIMFKDNVDERKRMEIIEKIGGKLINKIETIEYYIVKLNTNEKIENYCDKIEEQYSEIEMMTPNYNNTQLDAN